MSDPIMELVRNAARAGLEFRWAGNRWEIGSPRGAVGDGLLAGLKANIKPVTAIFREREAFNKQVRREIARSGQVPPRAWVADVEEAYREVDLPRLEVLAKRFKAWASGKLDGDAPHIKTVSTAGRSAGVSAAVVLDEAVRVPDCLDGTAVYTWDEVRTLGGAPLPVLRAVHRTHDVRVPGEVS